MQKQAGLSMALGAFLAGLLLAETEFSLQVESDIAPYRGLLLGLFFMTVCFCYLVVKNPLCVLHRKTTTIFLNSSLCKNLISVLKVFL